jgi:hypothetical protein
MPGPATTHQMPENRNVSPIPMSHAVRKRVANRDKEGELHMIVYAPIKRWPMGELAEMEEELVWVEVPEEACKEIQKSNPPQAKRSWIMEEGARA